MSVSHIARPGGIVGIYFHISLIRRYVVCSHQNRLVEAILMNTHNTVFNIKEKITLNYSKSAAIGFFRGIQDRV